MHVGTPTFGYRSFDDAGDDGQLKDCVQKHGRSRGRLQQLDSYVITQM